MCAWSRDQPRSRTRQNSAGRVRIWRGGCSAPNNPRNPFFSAIAVCCENSWAHEIKTGRKKWKQSTNIYFNYHTIYNQIDAITEIKHIITPIEENKREIEFKNGYDRIGFVGWIFESHTIPRMVLLVLATANKSRAFPAACKINISTSSGNRWSPDSLRKTIYFVVENIFDRLPLPNCLLYRVDRI